MKMSGFGLKVKHCWVSLLALCYCCILNPILLSDLGTSSACIAFCDCNLALPCGFLCFLVRNCPFFCARIRVFHYDYVGLMQPISQKQIGVFLLLVGHSLLLCSKNNYNLKKCQHLASRYNLHACNYSPHSSSLLLLRWLSVPSVHLQWESLMDRL